MNRVGQAKISELPVIFGVLLREYALRKTGTPAPCTSITPAVGRTQERSEQPAANGAKSQGVLLREYALRLFCGSPEVQPCCA